ncbi:MAG: DUF3078 domain-containing protein [Chitinophagales bacterium]
MKKLLTLLAVCISLAAISRTKAPYILDEKGNKILISKDSSWRFAGYIGLSGSQAAYYQWVPGNQFALSINFNAFAYANYKKGKWSWNNNLDAKYGIVALGRYKSVPDRKYPFKKSDDLLQINSLAGYNVAKGLDISLLLNFKTQFGSGYTYKLDSAGKEYSKTMTSKFCAPAFMKIGPGITYKPVDYFTLFFSPVTADFTFVDRSETRISNVPVEDRIQRVDETTFGLEKGQSVLVSAGAYLKANFQKDIVKNINYKTQIEVYYDYTYPNTIKEDSGVSLYKERIIDNAALRKEARQQVDVDWQNDVIFKVNKFISATLFWRIKYRWRELVPVDDNKDGFQDNVTKPDGTSVPKTRRGVQIAEVLGIGFSYKF